MKAERLIEIAERHVRKIFDKHHRICPMYHYVREDGQHCVFVPPEFCQTKDQSVAFARTVFEVESVVAYVYIDEAWTLSNDAVSTNELDRLYRDGGSISNVPGRKEVVLIMGEDQNGMCHGQMDLIRPKDRKPYLGKITIGRPQGLEGRMVGLLPSKAVSQ